MYRVIVLLFVLVSAFAKTSVAQTRTDLFSMVFGRSAAPASTLPVQMNSSGQMSTGKITNDQLADASLADGDDDNQDLTLSGNTLGIVGGSGVDLTPFESHWTLDGINIKRTVGDVSIETSTGGLLNLVNTDNTVAINNMYGKIDWISNDGSLQNGKKSVASIAAKNAGGAGSFSDLIFQVSNGTAAVSTYDAMILNHQGNLGIGANDPTSKLSFGNFVSGGTTTPNDLASHIALYELNGLKYGFGVASGRLTYLSGGFHAFYLGTNNPFEAARLTNVSGDGRFGVNVTDPSTDIDAHNGIRSRNLSGPSDSYIGVDASGTLKRLPNQPLAWRTDASLFIPSGFSGATAPYYFGAGFLGIRDNANSTKILLSANGDTYFNAGNLSIGTTNANAKLHVAGTGRFDGNLELKSLSANTSATQILVEGAGGRVEKRAISSLPGDNLGNHTATTDISLAGNKLEKLSFPTSTSALLEVATHKQKFGSGELVTAVTPTNFQITGPGGAGLYASSSSLLQLRLSSTEQYQFSTVGMTLPTQTGIANVSGTLAWNATRMRVRKGSDIEQLAYVSDEKLITVTMTSAGNVPAGTELLLLDASAGPMGVSLPDATTWIGNTIVLKRIDSSSNNVFISETNGKFIDGNNSTSLGQPWKTITIVSVGNQLLII